MSRAFRQVLKSADLRKKPTFGDATTGFPAKWRLRNGRRNSILIKCRYPDLGSASDRSCRAVNLPQPIRSTTQIWVVIRHQYGISALFSQTSISRGSQWLGHAMLAVFSGHEFSFNVLINARQLHPSWKRNWTLSVFTLDLFLTKLALFKQFKFSYSFQKTAIKGKDISLLTLKNT